MFKSYPILYYASVILFDFIFAILCHTICLISEVKPEDDSISVDIDFHENELIFRH